MADTTLTAEQRENQREMMRVTTAHMNPLMDALDAYVTDDGKVVTPDGTQVRFIVSAPTGETNEEGYPTYTSTLSDEPAPVMWGVEVDDLRYTFRSSKTEVTYEVALLTDETFPESGLRQPRFAYDATVYGWRKPRWGNTEPDAPEVNWGTNGAKSVADARLMLAVHTAAVNLAAAIEKAGAK